MSEVQNYVPFDRQVEAFNSHSHLRQLYVDSRQPAMNEAKSQVYFNYIDTLSAAIATASTTAGMSGQLLLRGVAYSAIQNFDSAIDDLSTYLTIDSTSVLALWQRAVCQSKINEFQASQGTDIDMKWANVLSDLSRAISLYPTSAYLYYNRGNLHIHRHDYASAISDYTQAIGLDPNLAEAYYNRGLARIEDKQTAEGIDDLSKAGELGLYTAYSLIKKYSK